MNMKAIIVENIGQILVFPIFLYYIHKYNDNKLVFGDHESHQLVFHPTQLLYLLVFAFVNLPITLGDFAHFFK